MFTHGILGLDEAQKMLSRNKLQESGTSSPCKKLHEYCTILLSKANMAGFYKVLCHVLPFSGQTVFTVLSLHINNVCAKRRGIAKKIIQAVRALMISQDIDLVAGDFNSAAWRCRSRDNLSSIDEAFADCALPTLPGPTPLWGPGSIPNNWADVCGFLKPPGSHRLWKVNKHGAFSFPRQALGLRANDQSCHHETWLHLQFVNWSNQWNHQAHYDGNIRLKERPASSGNRAPKRNIREVLSDHSLSS